MKSYIIKNKSLIKVLNQLEKLQSLILKFNENCKQRQYNINVERNSSNQYWTAEMNVNYEKSKENRTLKKVTEPFGVL